MAEPAEKLDEKAIVKQEAAPLLSFDENVRAMLPRNFEGLWRMASIMAKSGMMPKDMHSTETVFVAVQMGMEVGLPPMAAVQNIAVVNGRPSIWGDAVLGLIRASGLLESITETFRGTFPNEDFTAVCTAKRKGSKEEVCREFSVADAQNADLWCYGREGIDPKLKYTPWYKYPKRMLQMRARSWALRDGFGDVLRGLQVREEVQDIIDVTPSPNGTYTAPVQASPPPPTEPDTSDFDDCLAGVKPGYLAESLDKYLAVIAENQKISVAHVKSAAAEDFPRFWDSFLAWSSPKAEPGEPEPQEDEPTALAGPPDKWDTFRGEWINLRKPENFATYFWKNKHRFEQAPADLQKEAAEKWTRMGLDVGADGSPWPIDQASATPLADGLPAPDKWGICGTLQTNSPEEYQKFLEAVEIGGKEKLDAALRIFRWEGIDTTQKLTAITSRINRLVDEDAEKY